MEVKKFNRGQSAGKAFDEKLGNYLSGFTDGEGSFNISVINREKDYRHGWKISLCFNISQKDDTVPKIFQNVLGCGKIRYRKDGICYFDVRRTDDLVKIVTPFFKKFPLLSNKKKVFTIFCKALEIVKNKEHLTITGIETILKLRDKIIVGRKRKYSNKEILISYQKNPQRLYAKIPKNGI
jgi:hypothetical protein